MAHLVETSEEDSCLAVAEFIGNLIDADHYQIAPKQSQEGSKLVETPGSRFIEDCKAAYQAERYGELLERFIAHLDLLFSHAAHDQDLEGSVNIICHIVPRIPPPGTVSAAAALASGLAVPTASKPEHRLQALVNLYNVVYEPQSKLAVLVQTLAFSKACGLADVMLGVVRTHADTWVRDLGLSPEDERALYVACADALRACTRKPKTAAKEAYRLLTKHLTTFEESSLPEAASAASVASEVVAEFLRSPEMFTFDLGDSPAVVALAQNAQHAPLHRLLTVYLSGTVADFREVAAAHTQLFDTLGVTAEAALNKMQLLALMGLAHGTDELGFGAIATALDVAIEDVENIVVQAVGRRLLEARIDQLRSTVTVLRCSPRTFGAAQWRELQAQLRSWNETVSHVVEMGCDDQKVLQQGISELRVSVA